MFTEKVKRQKTKEKTTMSRWRVTWTEHYGVWLDADTYEEAVEKFEEMDLAQESDLLSSGNYDFEEEGK